MAMHPHIEATAEAIVVAVSTAIPALNMWPGTKIERDVILAGEVAIQRFLELLGTDQPALAPEAREVFVAIGAGEARENRGPEILTGALRMAARLMLRKIVESLARSRPVTPEEIVDLSDALMAYVDELAAAAMDGFTLQVREEAAETDRLRRRLAELLLRGSASESVVLTAASAVGWRTLDAVVPVVLPLDEARDARFRYATDGVVTERVRDAVLLLRDGPRTGRAQLTQSWAGRGAVVGPRLAWDRTPEAVRLAELVAEFVGPSTGPVFADDHLAALAVRGEPGALTVLSERRLAPLATLRDAQRERLLATLNSWLLHWGSRSEVAAELFVHPQTVTYRIAQLRELLGDDLDDPTARFELQLVLAFQTASGGRAGDAGAAAG
jgi:hypothetical protein